MKASWQAVSVEEGRAAVKRGELVWFRACADELRRFLEDFPLATGAICRTILGQPEAK